MRNEFEFSKTLSSGRLRVKKRDQYGLLWMISINWIDLERLNLCWRLPSSTLTLHTPPLTSILTTTTNK